MDRKIRRYIVSGHTPLAVQPGTWNPWMIHQGVSDTIHTLYLSLSEEETLAGHLASQGAVLTQVDSGLAQKPGEPKHAECLDCPWLGELGKCLSPGGDLSAYDDNLREAGLKCPDVRRYE